MAIDLPISNSNSGNDDKTSSSFIKGTENQLNNSQPSDDSGNPQELLTKASRDAELAKSTVREAISTAFRKREESLKRAEALAHAFEEAMENVTESNNEPSSPVPQAPLNSLDSANRGLVKHRPNNTSSQLADVIKTYFGSRPDTDAKKRINDLEIINQNKNSRRIIDRVKEDQADREATKVIGEAKSDRLASKLVVSQSQDEIKKIREEAELTKKMAKEEVRRALESAETARRDAEEAINLARRWIKEAKSEAMTDKKLPR